MVYHLAAKQRETLAAIGFLPNEATTLQRQCLPVPAAMLPATLEIEGKGKMPDIFEWQMFQFIVSEKARAVFEDIESSDFEYIEIGLHGSRIDFPSSRYFFLNLLTSNQLVDWSRVDRGKAGKLPDGRDYVRGPLPPPADMRKVYFKPLPTRYMWHERIHDTPDTQFAFYPAAILMTDDLARELNLTFPGQLDNRKLRTE